jgi:hypothetical protein
MAPDRAILHISKKNPRPPRPLATGIINKTHSFINIVSIEG